MAPNKPVPLKLEDYLLSYAKRINHNKTQGSIKGIQERISLLPLLKSGMIYIESRLDDSAALDLSCPIPFDYLSQYLQIKKDRLLNKLDLSGLQSIDKFWHDNESIHSSCRQIWIEFSEEQNDGRRNIPRAFLHGLNLNGDPHKGPWNLLVLERLIALAFLNRSELAQFDARCCADLFLKIETNARLMQLSVLFMEEKADQKPYLRVVLQIPSMRVIEQLEMLGVKLGKREIAFMHLIEGSQKKVALSLDIRMNSENGEVINAGIECYTTRKAEEIDNLFELINSYSQEFASCHMDRRCLEDIFEVKRITWPQCSFPVLTYRSISHVKFPLVTEEARPAKLYSCIEVARRSMEN